MLGQAGGSRGSGTTESGDKQMNKLKIEFKVTGDPRQAKELLKERLEVLPMVEEADVEIKEARQGFGEALSILMASVVILKLGTAAVAQFRTLLRELAALERDLTGTQSILVHVHGKPLKPSEIDDKTLLKLLEEMGGTS